MYTTVLVAHQEDAPIEEVSLASDLSVFTYQPDDWEKTVTDWFKVVPWGARHLVRWIRDTYGDEKGIIVTENGYHDSGNELDDLETRGRYHKVLTQPFHANQCVRDKSYETKLTIRSYQVGNNQ